MRMNFPTPASARRAPATSRPPICVLGLEIPDFFRRSTPDADQPHGDASRGARPRPGAKIVTISSHELLTKSNYQDAGRYNEVDLSIAADAEATLPALIEACRRLITPDRRRVIERARRSSRKHRGSAREQTLESAAWGWDASPISTARSSAEIWNQIKDEDWSLVSDTTFISNWPLKLWDFTKHYQYIGWSGAYGIGYGAPAAVGAALANRKHGRLSINIQCDGDLNYAPACCGQPRTTASRC